MKALVALKDIKIDRWYWVEAGYGPLPKVIRGIYKTVTVAPYIYVKKPGHDYIYAINPEWRFYEIKNEVVRCLYE